MFESADGNVRIFSGAGNDSVDAGAGDDFVNGGRNNTVLSYPGGVPAGSAGDTLLGGAGNDTISFSEIFQPITVFQGVQTQLDVYVNLRTNETRLAASGTFIS